MKKHQHYGELVAVAHFCAIQPEVACVVLIQVEPLPPSQLETMQPGCKKKKSGRPGGRLFLLPKTAIL